MNESDFTTLLERGSAGLDPDVERLVSGARTRGRSTVRRRRLGAGAAAVVLAIVAGAMVTTGSDRDGGADVARSPESAEAPMRFRGPQRALAPRSDIRRRLLEMLPAGRVTEVTVRAYPPSDRSGFGPGVEVSLLLDGAEVGLHLTDQTIDAEDWRPPEPGARPAGCDPSWTDARGRRLGRLAEQVDDDPAGRACLDWVVATQTFACSTSTACTNRRFARVQLDLCPPCERQPDESWLWARSGSGGDGSPSAMAGNWATRYTLDGWEVHAEAFNVVDDDAMEAEQVTDGPVLTLEQVTAIASSDVWFE